MPRQTTGREQGDRTHARGSTTTRGSTTRGSTTRGTSPRGAGKAASAAGSSQGSSSQSKLTSTGSRAARDAASATPEEERTRDQLYLRAAELGINGRSRMTKSELIAAIEQHGRRRP